MQLNDLTSIWSDFKLSEEEISLAKDFFQEHREMIEKDFNDIEWVKIFLKNYWYKDIEWVYNSYLTCLKAVVFAKENWATSMNDVNRIFLDTESTIISTNNTIEQSNKIDEVQKESVSEQIKWWEDIQNISS